ncbi:RNA polymerase subunit sigma [bacterium]|nr:RNA polymerase subunit sigma [bacterium]
MSLQRLRDPGMVVFLSGAGISAESGIPTFRGPEGYWTVGAREYHPQELATFHAFSQMPEEVWAWYLYRRSVCQAAQPNAGHSLLADLEQLLGERFLLVTQNVDGLHLRAGNSREKTYEVHGNIDYYRCAVNCCTEHWPLSQGFEDFAKGQKASAEQLAQLRCPRCQAWARPHVLWFDECYDEVTYRYESSRGAARQAVALVSVGTSGVTNLPLQMGRMVAGRGALLVDINPESNPFSQLAQESGGVWLRGKASQGLAQVMQVLKG